MPNYNESIDENKWKKIQGLIINKYKSDLSFVCISNSKEYFWNGNFRMALIEAVIALERALYNNLENYLDENDLVNCKHYFNNNSLTDIVKNVLPLAKDKLNISDNLIKVCLNAVNDRHLIVHKTCVNLNREKVKNYISTIDQIITKIVHKEF